MRIVDKNNYKCKIFIKKNVVCTKILLYLYARNFNNNEFLKLWKRKLKII